MTLKSIAILIALIPRGSCLKTADQRSRIPETTASDSEDGERPCCVPFC